MTTTTARNAAEAANEPQTRVLFFTNVDWHACQRMHRDLAAVVAGVAPIDVIDVWDNPKAVVGHEVITVPTVIVVHDGAEALRVTGLMSRRQLEPLRPALRRVPTMRTGSLAPAELSTPGGLTKD